MIKSLPVLFLFLGIILAGNPLTAQDEKAFIDAVSAARDMLRQKADSAAILARKAMLHAVDDVQRAEAGELCGDALRQAGDFEAAGVEYAQLLRQARETGDAQLLGRVLNGMGAIERVFENFGRSVAHHSEALRVFDSLGNALGAAQSMHDLAVTLVGMGESEQALEMHARALTMREEEKFRPAIAESHSSIAALYTQVGKLDSALLHYREALSLRKQLGLLSTEVASTLSDIGYVYRLQGDATRALDYYRESLGISRRLGDKSQIAETQKGIAAAYIRLRDYVRARESLDAALQLSQGPGLARIHADVLREQASLEEAVGNTAAALRLLRRHEAVTDSLDRQFRTARLRHVGSDGEAMPRLVGNDTSGSIGSDFMVFLVVVIGLLVIIVGIALSTLRMRGRVNRALSGKNSEIESMNAELQRLNHDLARSEEKYRLLFERLPVGVFLYDAEMTLLQVNDAFADIIGSPREKLLGLNLGTLRDRRIMPTLQAAINGKTGAYEGEYLVSTNNSTLQVSIRTAPLQYRDLRTPHGIGFVFEISNWKRVEHDLIESREIAVQADRLKNAFLTNISHEIRTPLNIIMGYFGILHQDMRDRIDEEEADYFHKVDVAVRRLLRTVDQILTLSILESGSYAMNLEQCHLHDLAFELYEELLPLAKEKGLEVEFESGCRDVYINVDRYSIGQALRNLLDNAVKFTDAGTIHISLKSSGTHISIIVRDTGIGMSQEYVRELFEAFSQEDSGYSRSYEGLGIGLRLTKRYLDVNDGTIHVESAKGEGTTFVVSFPIARRFAHLQPAVEAPVRVLAEIGLRRTLLVVEDDHETQKFLQLILASSFDLHFADSAEDAWDTLHGTPIDLVLMDISLRGDEDGLQLTGRIREDAQLKELPVIAVTAHAFADDRRRSLEAGCNEYLPKPFRVNQLRELVDRFLQA